MEKSKKCKVDFYREFKNFSVITFKQISNYFTFTGDSSISLEKRIWLSDKAALCWQWNKPGAGFLYELYRLKNNQLEGDNIFDTIEDTELRDSMIQELDDLVNDNQRPSAAMWRK